MKESPIFIKSFETLLWLLEHTKKFPKHQRFVMAKRCSSTKFNTGLHGGDWGAARKSWMAIQDGHRP